MSRHSQLPQLDRRTFVGLLSAGSAATLLAAARPAPTMARVGGRPALQTSEPREGGVLTFALRTEPDTLDPHKTVSEYSARVLTNVLDPLIWQSNDLTFHPGLAERWEISPDGLTYTFHLRRGLRFHDGEELTAEAVKFSFDRIVDPSTASKSAIGALGPYDRTEVVDESTAVLHLTAPFSPLLVNLASPYLAPISPAAVQRLGDDFSRAPVGAGPYLITEWERNDRITLDRFADYTWAPAPFGRQSPGYLDQIVFRIVPEGGPRLAALETGEAHVIEYTPTHAVEQLMGDDSYVVHVIPRPGMPRALPINVTRPPTDELPVRQAILHAIDPAAVNQTVNFGVNELAYGPLSPVTFAYDPAVEGMYPFDPAMARGLLEQAGWTVGEGGIRERAGERLALRYVTWASDELTRIAESVQAQLRDVGIDSEIEAPDYSAAVPIYIAGEHNLGSTGYVMTDPDVLSVIFHSDQIETALNKTHYQDPAFDALVEQAASTVDPKERAVLYSQAQRQVMELALIKPLYQQTGITTTAASVQGLQFNSSSYELLYGVWLAD